MEAIQHFFKALMKSTLRPFRFAKVSLKRQNLLPQRFQGNQDVSSVQYPSVKAKPEDDDDGNPPPPTRSDLSTF